MNHIKTLLLFRHAKSSWSNPDLADHDRPLNPRGRTAAARMGRLIREEGHTLDLILASTSRRTRETAEIALAEAGIPLFPVQYRDDLYHADPDQLTTVLSGLSAPYSSVMLLGHNPGFEDFLERHTGERSKFPTAGLAIIEFELKSWTDFSNSRQGTLRCLWKPKKLEDGTQP